MVEEHRGHKMPRMHTKRSNFALWVVLTTLPHVQTPNASLTLSTKQTASVKNATFAIQKTKLRRLLATKFQTSFPLNKKAAAQIKGTEIFHNLYRIVFRRK